MSINVTVTGNPVNIRRGKMVTADPNHTRKEFQKRKQMRLEQVRQQSKEIAECVRNKVRKEKSKQLSNVEKAGAAKFNEWQNKKLLELQTQYQEALKDIGIGHTQAMLEEASEADYMDRRDKSNERSAKQRGTFATQQEQINKNEKSLRDAIPAQTRRMARDIENTRAAIVSRIPKTPKKRRNNTNVFVSRDLSESESECVEIVDIARDDSDSEQYSQIMDNKNKSEQGKAQPKPSSPKRSRTKSPIITENNTQASLSSKANASKFNENKRRGNDEMFESGTKRSLSPKGLSNMTSVEPNADTRISDRINNRRILESRKTVPQVLSTIESSDLSLTSPKQDDNDYNNHSRRRCMPHKGVVHNECSPRQAIQDQFSNPCGIQNGHDAANRGTFCNLCNPNVPINTCCCCKNRRNNTRIVEQSCACRSTGLNTNVKTCSCRSSEPSNPKLVEIPSKPTISIRSEVPLTLEKKEYNRVQHYDHPNRFSKDVIMDNANVQRISEDSIQVCTNEESCVHQEQIKATRDNMALARGKRALAKEKIQKEYKELLQKLPVLEKQERIASLDPNKDKFHMSENRLKQHEEKRQQKIESAFEKLVPNTITIPPKRHAERTSVDVPFKVVDTNDAPNVELWKSNEAINTDNLKSLLEKLKSQRKILLQENDSLPVNSNLYKIISDLEKSRRASSNNRSTGSPTNSHSPRRKRSKIRQKNKSVGSSTHSATPKHKQNSRKDVLILQNISTQTSPKIESPHDSAKEPQANEKHQTNKSDVKGQCLCNEMSDKICEIFIKIQENEKPEIIISSPKKLNEIDIDIKSFETKASVKPRETVAQGVDSKSTKIQETIEISGAQAKSTKSVEGKSTKLRDIITKAVESKSIEIKKTKPQETNNKATKLSTSEARKRKPPGNNSSVIDKSSWKEQLSRNDTNSSTSYYSPPNYSSKHENLLNILQNKPQQSNIGANQKSKHVRTVDTNLLTYVKRLLLMSKPSVDDLGVSSVTEVSTPSSSVIETQSNSDEAHKLINLLKTINFNVDQIGQYTHNTLISNSASRNSSFVHSSGYNASRSRTIGSTQHTEYHHSGSRNDDASQRYPDDLAKNITEITDKCQRKINKLAAKIQSLRAEPLPIFSPGASSGSDKENITSYMNLPSNTSDNSHSPEQIELTRKLLQIDTKKFTGTLSGAENDLLKKLAESVRQGNKDEVDSDIINRYLKLLASDDSVNKTNDTEKLANSFVPLLDIPKLPKFPAESSTLVNKRPPTAKGLSTARKYNGGVNVQPHELSTIPEIETAKKSKSPELRSRMSSPTNKPDQVKPKSPQPKCQTSSSGKLSSEESALGSASKTSESQSDSFSPQQDIGLAVTIDSKRVSPQPGPSRQASPAKGRLKPISPSKNKLPPQPSVSPRSPEPGTSKQNPNEDNVKRYSSADIAQIVQKLQDISTDSSSGKSEDVEAMLKSMGMGWAIATLRKTQEALAQESSTSSVDNSSKPQSISDSSQTKPSTSTMSKSDISISPFLKNTFKDVSAIHGSTAGAEKRHCTSTPVQTTKSSEKSKSNSRKSNKVDSAESDETSVRERSDVSDDQNMKFLSIPSVNDSTMDD